ncbi:MAG TPA: DUF4190 domain-containing protein [Pirellulales bacterium]|nr:DUF4190 domain-containing protein [Pirellulales bacterium]
MSIGVQSKWGGADVAAQARYRPLSTLAVASCLWAVVALAALVDWSLLVLPIVGVVLGAIAWQRVRRHSDEMAGRGLAVGGMIANSIVLLGSWCTLAYVHAQEVPPGCIAVDYEQLQPNPAVPGQQVSDFARQLNGHRVLLKGYALAGRQTENIKQFVLMRDNLSCCFGSDPKPTDMVAVTVAGARPWTYTKDLVRVAGTFHVVPAAADGRKQPL